MIPVFGLTTTWPRKLAGIGGDVLTVEECDFLPPELPKKYLGRKSDGFYGWIKRAYYPKSNSAS